MPVTSGEVKAKICEAVFAALLVCVAGLPLSDALAQGSGCASDAKIASALDNYRLAWVPSKGRVGAGGGLKTLDSPGTFWARVTDETHDGVDSLRSGAIGDNEHAELTAHIKGPATLRFWWKVDSQEHADYLTFTAVTAIETGTANVSPAHPATELGISGERGWTDVEVPLPEATDYRVRWSYVKDTRGAAGADAGWIDAVRVEGPGYGKIELDPPEIEGRSVKLSWPTLPCRYYQVEWRHKTGTAYPWQPMIPKVEPATGVKGSLFERPNLYDKRRYRVTLIEPPSFTRMPASRKIAKKEGEPLTLSYQAEGTEDIIFAWRFQGASTDQPARQPTAAAGRRIVSPGGRATLRFDALTEANEGKYILIAENGAGRERAPAVSVAVFQPPRLLAFVVREAEEPERRIVVDDTGPPEVSVNAGESLEIEAKIAGSETIEAVWERKNAATGQWVTEGLDLVLRFAQVTPEEGGRYRVALGSLWGEWEGPRVIEVTVNTSPKILCVRTKRDACLEEGRSIEVNQFEPLSLTVEVEGTGTLSYQWFRENHPVPEEKGGKTPVVTVSTNDAGEFDYIVQVRNSAGPDHTGPYKIKIKPAKPRISHVKFNKTQTASEDLPIFTRQYDPLELSVQVEGALPFSYQWYRDGKPIPKSHGGESAKVTVATDHFGAYTLYAEVMNKIGTVKTFPIAVRIAICSPKVFHNRKKWLSSPLEDCSLAAAALEDKIDLFRAEIWQLRTVAAAQVALGYLNEAFRVTGWIKNYNVRNDTYRDIALWLSQKGDFDTAIASSFKIDELDDRISTLNEIAITQAHWGHEVTAKKALSNSVEVAMKIPDLVDREEALADIAIARAEAGDIKGALLNVEWITSTQIKDHSVFRIVVKHVSAMGSVRAKRALKLLTNPTGKAIALSYLAIYEGDNGSYDQAMTTLDEAVDIANDSRDWREKLQIFSHVATAQFKLGHATTSAVTLNAMSDLVGQTESMRNKLHIWAHIAFAKGRMGKVEEAFAIIEKQKENTVKVVRSGGLFEGWFQVARVIDELIDEKLKRGEFTEALNIVKDIADHYDRMRGLKRIAVAQATSGNKKGAKQTLTEIDEIYNNTHDFRIRELYFTAQVEAGFVARALEAVSHVEMGARHEAYRAIGRGLQYAIHKKNGRAWNITSAIDIAQTISERGTRVSLLSGIAALSARASR